MSAVLRTFVRGYTRLRQVGLLALGLVLSPIASFAAEEETKETRPARPPKQVDVGGKKSDSTHTVARSFSVGSKSGGTLQGLALLPKGDLVALVGMGRYGVVEGIPSEIQILDATGKVKQKWGTEFGASAIAVDGSAILVSGSGRIARYDATGKRLDQKDLPFVESALKDAASLEKELREAHREELKGLKESLKSMEREAANWDEQNNKKPTKTKDGKEGKVVEQETSAESILSSLFGTLIGQDSENPYKQQVQQMKRYVAQHEKKTPKDLVDEATKRLKSISSLATSDKDVFVVSGKMSGYGFSVWRLDSEFKTAKVILPDLSGCCGQMDIDCCEGELLVAENTRKRAGRYSFDGKFLGSVGKNDRTGAGGGFGGCCNPMNVQGGPNQTIFTAESEGIVKQFDKNGKFLGVVGVFTLTGGCKNVAFAADTTGERIFVMDLPGSRVVVLEGKAKSPLAKSGK